MATGSAFDLLVGSALGLPLDPDARAAGFDAYTGSILTRLPSL